MVLRVLTSSNIEAAIRDYLAETNTIAIPAIPTTDPIAYFANLKRTPVSGGRYPGHSVFEVANRTLSDLVVLAFADELLREPLPGQLKPLASVTVLLGTEQHAAHDVMGVLPDGSMLCAECFNVAPTFFMSKLTKTRKKLRAVRETCVKMMAYNADAVAEGWKHRPDPVIHRPIDVSAFLARYRT